MNLKNRIIEILDKVFSDESELNAENLTPEDKLQLLPSESLLALQFITCLEDEFSFEFEDDQLDIDFFNDLDLVIQTVRSNVPKTN